MLFSNYNRIWIIRNIWGKNLSDMLIVLCSKLCGLVINL